MPGMSPERGRPQSWNLSKAELPEGLRLGGRRGPSCWGACEAPPLPGEVPAQPPERPLGAHWGPQPGWEGEGEVWGQRGRASRLCGTDRSDP